MRKNSPVKGHHGIGARGQGKLLYFHSQTPQAAVRQPKEQQPSKGQQPRERRQPNGRWAP
ncbi:hypothetical protein [Streptomyces sp. NPDC046805]|uniref:hypothetical protein n=1 Tax=Streptomyces sp. NPDC046805 TaxID=3155134 RepID=UPI0033C8B690